MSIIVSKVLIQGTYYANMNEICSHKKVMANSSFEKKKVKVQGH